MQQTNRIEIAGAFETPDPLRMTPAGVPSLKFSVRHTSSQTEGGKVRQVECRLDAVAIGEIAREVVKLTQGTVVNFHGFLARASQRSEWPVLHVLSIKHPEQPQS